MSKQSISKHEQGYVEKALLPVCMNCKNYHSEMKETRSVFGWGEPVEKNKSCKLGNFVVKKMATCKMFAAKPEAKKEAA